MIVPAGGVKPLTVGLVVTVEGVLNEFAVVAGMRRPPAPTIIEDEGEGPTVVAIPLEGEMELGAAVAGIERGTA